MFLTQRSVAFDVIKGPTVPSSENVKVSLLHVCCSGSNLQGEIEGPCRVLCQLKKPSSVKTKMRELLEGMEENSSSSLTRGH